VRSAALSTTARPHAPARSPSCGDGRRQQRFGNRSGIDLGGQREGEPVGRGRRAQIRNGFVQQTQHLTHFRLAVVEVVLRQSASTLRARSTIARRRPGSV